MVDKTLSIGILYPSKWSCSPALKLVIGCIALCGKHSCILCLAVGGGAVASQSTLAPPQADKHNLPFPNSSDMHQDQSPEPCTRNTGCTHQGLHLSMVELKPLSLGVSWEVRQPLCHPWRQRAYQLQSFPKEYLLIHLFFSIFLMHWYSPWEF